MDGSGISAGAGKGNQDSRAVIVACLRRHGSLTRAELARRSGVSRSTASMVVGDLLSAGVAVEASAQQGESQVGRPGVLVSLNPAAGVAVGVDIGHRRLRVAAADLSHALLAETERALPVDHNPYSVLDLASQLVEETLEEARVQKNIVVGVGVGLPAPFQQITGEIHPSSLPSAWAGVFPAREMERRIGLPAFPDNDANLAALAEIVWGSGQGMTEAACVMISDGIGAGLILDGRIYRGAMGTAGEIGHTTVDDYGPICRCGNRGCLEMLAGVPAIIELLRPSRGEELTIREVLELSASGDTACRRAISDAGHLVGMAVANLCNLFNPRRVIVNGVLSEAGDVLLDSLRTSLARGALPVAAEVEVVLGQLGARASVLGAVALALRETDSFAAAPDGHVKTG